jgi:AcrR family transcriptional regulator
LFEFGGFVSQTLNRVEWVKPTHQARSQETLERLLDAAEEVVSEKGFDNATVSEIVRRAKSSVGAMYARFNDKDSLLVCLHERFCEQAMATAEVALDASRWEGATIAEVFATAMPFLVNVYHLKRGLVRAFIVRGSSDHQFAERAGRLSRAISERLIALLAARRDEIKHPDPVLAADFGLRMTFDTLDQATLFSDIQRSTIRYSPEQLAEELTRAFLSYLGAEMPPTWDISR